MHVKHLLHRFGASVPPLNHRIAIRCGKMIINRCVGILDCQHEVPIWRNHDLPTQAVLPHMDYFSSAAGGAECPDISSATVASTQKRAKAAKGMLRAPSSAAFVSGGTKSDIL